MSDDISKTEERSHQLLSAARPLIKWLNENSHPHCAALVTPTSVKLTEDLAKEITYDYVQN